MARARTRKAKARGKASPREAMARNLLPQGYARSWGALLKHSGITLKYKMLCYDCSKKRDCGQGLNLYSDKEWWTNAKRIEFCADNNRAKDSSRAYTLERSSRSQRMAPTGP